MSQCYLLGFYELPGGSCAQWFSGTASALAVAVALTAHFYAAWRQRKEEHRQDAAEMAGLSMSLRGILGDAESNVNLFKTRHNIILWGVNYTLSNRLGAVRATRMDALDKNQADVLLRYNEADLATQIDRIINKINLANLAIEDYARFHDEFYVLYEKYVGMDVKDIIKDDPDVKLLIKRFSMISEAAEKLIAELSKCLEDSIGIAKKFNEFCTAHKAFSNYGVETEKFSNLLSDLAPETNSPGSKA